MARISPDGSGPAPETDRATDTDRTPETSAADRLQALESKIENLLVAVESQRLIGVAVGLLAQQERCTTEEAWRLLARSSQDSNVKVRDLARTIVDDFDGLLAG